MLRLTLTLLALPLFMWAPHTLAAGMESYSARPDIATLSPKAHPELGADWARLKRGHLEAVAQMLELYPDRELYFLARDGELLFDAAKALTASEPDSLSRLHLLNISRGNMNAEHVVEYLAQEGISEQRLAQAGKKVMFIDTGFSGTIPRNLKDKFSPGAAAKMQTHLLVSASPEHPSSRVFLTALNAAAADHPPGVMHNTIIEYEHMPRFTDRSIVFEKVGARWEPMSPHGTSTDGSVSPERAVAYMQDLLHYLRQPESQKLFRERRALWRSLGDLANKNEFAALEHKLKELVDSRDPYQIALVRDFVEARHAPIQLQKLGLKLIDNKQAGLTVGSNKHALIAANPQWDTILSNPDEGIKKLIQEENWGVLGAITDVIQDKEFDIILSKEMAGAKPSAKARMFAENAINVGRPNLVMEMAKNYFPAEKAGPLAQELRPAFEKRLVLLMNDLYLDTARPAIDFFLAELKSLPSETAFDGFSIILRRGEQHQTNAVIDFLKKNKDWPPSLWKRIPAILNNNNFGGEDFYRALATQPIWPEDVWQQAVKHLKKSHVMFGKKVAAAIAQQKEWPSSVQTSLAEAFADPGNLVVDDMIPFLEARPPKLQAPVLEALLQALPSKIRAHYQLRVNCQAGYSGLAH